MSSVTPSPNRSDQPLFNKMGDKDFEEMCCALLSKEPDIISADLFGRPREPQFGIDVEGKIADNDGVVVISCKCYSTIKRGNMSSWSDAFLDHWPTYWQGRNVRRFILATAADVKSSARQKEIDTEKTRFKNIGVAYEIWAPRHLPEKMRLSPGLVSQFLGHEWVQRLCAFSGLLIADPRELLKERWNHGQACEFEKAAACAEEAARIARDINDKNILLKALRCAVGDLGELLISKHHENSEAKNITLRIASYLAELETLDISEAELALAKAMFATLEKRAIEALEFAELAEKKACDPETVADALVSQLQAYWQMNRIEDALKLKDRIQEVTNKLTIGEVIIVLQGTWLRTLCKSKSADADLQSFIGLVRKLVAEGQVSSARTLMLVDDVLSEFGRASDLVGVKGLLEVALELSSNIPDPSASATYATQSAELEAEFGNELESKINLGIADKWIDILKSKGEIKKWAYKKAMALITRGSVESRLAIKMEGSDYDRSLLHRKAAYLALKDAMGFVKEHEVDIIGEVGPFIADLSIQLGDAAKALGRYLEAAGHYRLARTDQIMADKGFREIGMRSWVMEADAVVLSGKTKEALSLLSDMVASPLVPDDLRTHIQKNINFLTKHVVSVTDWFGSKSASDICQAVSSAPEGLRIVIAEQMRPLVEWFCEFSPKDGAGHAYSELFDIWWRGVFSRIVAAVRSDPLNAISVDAICIADIKYLARVFCPLYDTVIINWKGPLFAGLGVVPIPDNVGNLGHPGAQGYELTSTFLPNTWKNGCFIGVGWGNYLPKDVAEFLAMEALPLIQSGRLVLFPASLVGCTQSAVGWTDNLLVDTFLGGVVKTAGTFPQDAHDTLIDDNRFRLLDLGMVNVPFIDNISLYDLSQILDETTEWLSPLRRLLQKTVGSNPMRHELWDSIRPYFSDIRDAFRQLEEGWKSLIRIKPQRTEWHIADATSTFSAASRRYDTPGSDSMTDILRSIAGNNPDLGPWIPFWRLQNAGGQINWTRQLVPCLVSPLL